MIKKQCVITTRRQKWKHFEEMFVQTLHYHELKIKGKESENSYQELKRSQKRQAHTNTRKLNRDISTGMAVFLNRKRVNVCEHTTKTASVESLWKVPPGGCERDGWREIIWD